MFYEINTLPHDPEITHLDSYPRGNMFTQHLAYLFIIFIFEVGLYYVAKNLILFALCVD